MTAGPLVPSIALVAALVLLAGCTQTGTPASPIPTAAGTSVVTPAPSPAEETPAGVPATTAPGPSATGTEYQVPPSPAPVPVLPAGYQLFRDADYTLEYPSSWQSNESTLPMPEFIHTLHGCMVTSYYQTSQHVRFFTSPDGSALIYASVIDTETDVWPRDLRGQIVYADIVNAFLGDPTHCANTPAGAFTISSVTQAQVPGVTYSVARADFGKINSSGFADGSGTIYVVTGNHKHGIVAFYAANSSGGVWDLAGQNMFNTLSLNTYF